MFDLDALETEAEQTPFVFRFGGQQFELPPSPDMMAFAAIAEGQLYTGLKILLGDEQHRRMVEAKATFNAEKLAALMEQYAGHIGLTLGKSPASAARSSSTARPSRRTSNGTTASRSRGSQQVR